jgi:hypothetical protein
MSIDKNNIATGINNAICETVSTIANRAIEQAGYDKTIQATIVQCVDATIGKYQVRYQDTLFYAYATSVDVTYANKTSVYVLVPNNDFRKEKTIVGTVQKLGINYVQPVTEKDSYEINGANCIGNSTKIFKLTSYENESYLTVYKKDEIDELNIDQNALKLYLYDSDAMVCNIRVENHLPASQRYQGNYGVIFTLRFTDNTGVSVTRDYSFDISQMTGNPYKFITPSEQTKAFRIDGINFDCVEEIKLFANGFPVADAPDREENPNKYWNIIFSKMEISGGIKLSEQDLNGYKLTFLATKGTYFTAADEDNKELPIQAQVRIKGKVAATDADNIKYYWFRENARIGASSKYYSTIGGQGWECLNSYITIDDNTVEFVPATFEYIAVKERFTAKETSLKCCAMYNDETIIENTIPIKNLGSDYEITVSSSNGTQFYYDSGETDLKCSVSVEGEYNYYWSMTDNNNHYKSLEETSNILRVQASSITDFSTYTCTVYKKDGESELFYGSAQIRITNSLEAPARTMVVINNGTKVYKYSESGISPAAKSQPNPEIIHPLTFTVYDETRKEITADFKTVTWKVPKQNTMISVIGDVEPIQETEDYYIYDTRELIYEIDERFNADKNNNDIILAVECRDLKLVAQTYFTFTKDGDIGTNGTNFYCKIDYNIAADDIRPHYPMVWKDAEGEFHKNWNSLSDTWFKVRLWEGNAEITEGFTEEWKVLANKYNYNTSDLSHFTVTQDENSGEWIFGLTGLSTEETAADIIQVKVVYDEKTYYATLPIVYAEMSNEYIEWIPRTGFNSVIYQADGTHPAYNNNYPFEITLVDSAEYIWETKGYTTKEEDLLRITNTEHNKLTVRPASLYDGYCVNTSVACKVMKQGQQLAYINIPIHMYFNRFGQEALNGWDGNSIQLDEEGGHIYSPQVGAGIKDSNNRFTGVLMGKVKEHSNSQELVGLLGYNEGVRSIFLDSKTGKAEFGAAGGGQIILDPRDKTAKIYSSDYSTTDKKGMLIDFTTPEIKFGSGYFNVDKDGWLTAQRGTIAGWDIGDNALTKGNVGISSDNSVNTNIAFWAGSSNADNGKFKVDFTGKVTASDIHASGGTIGNWEVKNNRLQTSDGKVYLSTSELKIRDNFSVNGSTGVLTAKQASLTDITATGGTFNNITVKKATMTDIDAQTGTIGGWDITSSGLSKGSMYIRSNGSIGRTDNKWYIDTSGNAYFTGGKIGNWEIKSGAITNGTATLKSTGDIEVAGSKATINMSQDGTLTATRVLLQGGVLDLGYASIRAGNATDKNWIVNIESGSDGGVKDHVTFGFSDESGVKKGATFRGAGLVQLQNWGNGSRVYLHEDGHITIIAGAKGGSYIDLQASEVRFNGAKKWEKK